MERLGFGKLCPPLVMCGVELQVRPRCQIVYHTWCRCCCAVLCVSRASAAERQQRERPGVLWPAAQRRRGAGRRRRQNSRHGEMDGAAGDVNIKLSLLGQFVRRVRVRSFCLTALRLCSWARPSATASTPPYRTRECIPWTRCEPGLQLNCIELVFVTHPAIVSSSPFPPFPALFSCSPPLLKT
jgi:hypothetical protein